MVDNVGKAVQTDLLANLGEEIFDMENLIKLKLLMWINYFNMKLLSVLSTNASWSKTLSSSMV